MNICRQCFRERSAQIGFEKVRTHPTFRPVPSAKTRNTNPSPVRSTKCAERPRLLSSVTCFTGLRWRDGGSGQEEGGRSCIGYGCMTIQVVPRKRRGGLESRTTTTCGSQRLKTRRKPEREEGTGRERAFDRRGWNSTDMRTWSRQEWSKTEGCGGRARTTPTTMDGLLSRKEGSTSTISGVHVDSRSSSREHWLCRYVEGFAYLRITEDGS
jgi:hypothetical protein